MSAKLAGDTGIVIAADREAAKRKRPSDLTAYDLYLLGSAAIYRETPEDNEEAIALLKQSLEIDPGFGARLERLCRLALLAEGTGGVTPPRTEQLRLEAAERAVKLDPQDADAHAALALAAGS